MGGGEKDRLVGRSESVDGQKEAEPLIHCDCLTPSQRRTEIKYSGD